MGKNVSCTAQFGGQVSKGKAHLETQALIFRGDFRLFIPLRAIRSVQNKEGRLFVTYSEGVAVFDLGAQAEKWAQAIRSPKSVIDKLDVKSDSRVAVLGIEDEAFFEQLRQRTEDITTGKHGKDLDLIFFSADSLAALKKLARLREAIKSNGVIWVVSLKGKQAQIKDLDVIAAARKAGLVDTKVVSFSETHTALKLVIPLVDRNQVTNDE